MKRGIFASLVQITASQPKRVILKVSMYDIMLHRGKYPVQMFPNQLPGFFSHFCEAQARVRSVRQGWRMVKGLKAKTLALSLH